MIRWSFAIACLACMNTAHGEQWTPLFDGKSLARWAHVGQGSFEIENGLLRSRGGMGLLWFTGQKFADVRIRVLYRTADGGNSGVFIRIPDRPTEPWMPVNKGYEVQIDHSGDPYHLTGVLYSLTRAKAPPPQRDGWNEMLITLDGDRTTVEVNGVLITDHREGDPVPAKAHDYEPDRGPRSTAGYIGLQNHGERDTIYFKDVSYQPLAK